MNPRLHSPHGISHVEKGKILPGLKALRVAPIQVVVRMVPRKRICAGNCGHPASAKTRRLGICVIQPLVQKGFAHLDNLLTTGSYGKILIHSNLNGRLQNYSASFCTCHWIKCKDSRLSNGHFQNSGSQKCKFMASLPSIIMYPPMKTSK